MQAKYDDPGPLSELPLTVLARLATAVLDTYPLWQREEARRELDETLNRVQCWRCRRVYIDFLQKQGVNDGR